MFAHISDSPVHSQLEPANLCQAAPASMTKMKEMIVIDSGLYPDQEEQGTLEVGRRGILKTTKVTLGEYMHTLLRIRIQKDRKIKGTSKQRENALPENSSAGP